jgi:predicted nucleic acid-binding protein
MNITICQERVVLDACVIIELLRRTRLSSRILGFFKGRSARVELQDVVIAEVSRITALSKSQIIHKISNLLHQTMYVFVTTDAIKLEALNLTRIYCYLCHFPDSLILASCKLRSWTLLTLDRNMAGCAELDGIRVFNPHSKRGL